MPFTPFHFGPGLFAKSLAARYFSWLAFIFSQVIIDLETLYYLTQRTYPLHRFFHTFLGATIAGLFTGVVLMAAKLIIEKFALQSDNFINRLSPSTKAELSNTGFMVGALVGGVSHPLLDGIMHRDVRPFAPWSDANPLLLLIDIDALHLGCFVLGILGLLLMTVRLYREKLANKSLQPTRPANG